MSLGRLVVMFSPTITVEPDEVAMDWENVCVLTDILLYRAVFLSRSVPYSLLQLCRLGRGISFDILGTL